MEGLCVLKGIVLKSMPMGEYDKRISLLTLERGRVSAFLKGAKRPKGSPLSAVEPFCFGEFSVYEGKSYTIRAAEIKNHFKVLKKDISAISYGSYFLDMAEYYSRENDDESGRLKLLYQSLRALESERFEKEFVRLVFELKNTAINGEYPNVFECLECKKREGLSFFSMEKRGCICGDCAGKAGNLIRVSSPAVYALDFIFRTPPEKIFSFMLSDQVFSELNSLYEEYKKRYFPHKFKTAEFLGLGNV